MRVIFAALMVPGATFVACGSSVETEGASGITREQACDDVAKAICDEYEKCVPLLIDVGYGEVAKCYERSKAACASTFDAPGTTMTPAKASTCATGLRTLSCEALSTSTPAACVPDPGALADGAACAEDGQCKSTWCAKNDDANCGKCAALTTVGGACVDVGLKADGSPQKKCSRGLGCTADKCAKPSETGGACSDTQPCALGLACFGAKCVAAGKAGSKCDPAGKTDPPCDIMQGAYCNPTTKVCQTFVQAKAGETCGVVGTEYKICVAGAKCVTAPGTTSGTCIAPAIDGAACDAKKGPDCLAPAKCITGVCKLPDPSVCK